MDIDIGIWYWVWAYARKGYFHMGVGSGVEIGLNQDRRGLVWLLIFCSLSLFSGLEKHKYLNRILDKEEYFLIEEKILINLSSW